MGYHERKSYIYHICSDCLVAQDEVHPILVFLQFWHSKDSHFPIPVIQAECCLSQSLNHRHNRNQNVRKFRQTTGNVVDAMQKIFGIYTSFVPIVNTGEMQIVEHSTEEIESIAFCLDYTRIKGFEE